LLTWREPGEQQSLPADLLAILELKQKATLVFPFEEQFLDRLEALVRTTATDAGRCGPELAMGHQCDAARPMVESVDDVLRRGLALEQLLPVNRTSALQIIEETSTELRKELVGYVDASGLQVAESPRRVATEIMNTVRIAFMNACIIRFGRPFCEPLTHRDERVPFGVIYQSQSTTENILRLATP
jgi:hypothetical protein